MKHPENPFKFYSPNPQESDDKLLADIIEFTKKHDFTSEELKTSYEMALGIHQDDADSENPIREEVYVLTKKIDEYTKNGLPLNRIKELIGTKMDYEQGTRKYFLMVNSMLLTDKEKRVLRSIVEKNRKGILTILDANNGREMAEIPILPKDSIGSNTNQIALYLVDKLNKFTNQNIQITFAE